LNSKNNPFYHLQIEARGVIAAPVQVEVTADENSGESQTEPPLLILNNKAITGESGDNKKKFV
jgi:hypothetical protein